MSQQVTRQIPGFDLSLTASSGQCFRFNKLEDGCFDLIAHGKRLRVKDLGSGRFAFDCAAEDFEKIWRPYFDIDRDYGAIGASIDAKDVFLLAAYGYACGLRILCQNPWETLISFIISQRKNIPAIKGCVETISRRFGDQIDETGWAFPQPGQLACLTLEQLQCCSLGYRSGYILHTARQVAEGKIDLDALSKADDTPLEDALLALPGVGVKVANCVMLFGYHRLDAFPRDVWISRVLANEYPQGFPFERFCGFAGIVQQYMFCFARSSIYKKMQEYRENTAISSN